MIGDVEERPERDEADELGVDDGDASGSRQSRDTLEDAPHGRSSDVEQVHRDLDTAERRQLDAQRLHPGQAAVPLADGMGDGAGERKVSGVQLDVPRDEEGASAGDRGPRGGMWARRAELRAAIVPRERIRESLEARPPDVRQDASVWSARRLGVEEHRQPIPFREPCAEVLGKGDACLHRGPADRYERDDVQRAHPRVTAMLVAQVDPRDRLGGERLHRGRHGGRAPGEREHAPVVVGVRGAVQEADPRDVPDGTGTRVHHLGPSPLADVGDALDDVHPMIMAGSSRHGGPRPPGSGYHRRVHRHRDDAHAVSEAAQAYLLTLRSMEGGGPQPMTASLARRMHVSVQAASEMVSRLAAEGLVEVRADRTLALSPSGWRAADTIFRRHALMEWLLTRVVGLGWAESDEEAMRLQGAISPRVEQAIDDLLGHPQTCPHGNPMDSATARKRPAGIPLADARPDSDVTILRITEEAEEDAELLVYLEEQGLVPGVRAHVTDISRARDSITFIGPRGQGSMGLRPASLIRVLEGAADPTLFHRVPDRIAGLHR